MINIAKLLKDAPKGMKLYSPLFGEVEFKYVNDSKFGIVVKDSDEYSRSFDKYGRYFTEYNNAECLLFPSKDCRTWEGWKLPVEPKFKVGDWIVYKDGRTFCGGLKTVQVQTVEEDRYIFTHATNGSHRFIDSEYRLWEISDAKDGDVLATDNGWTCIFKAFDGYVFSSYCFMDSQKWFCEVGSEAHTLDSRINGNIHPATKEQCNQFFVKMKEAGYTWDSEKKELKKIPKHYDITNFQPKQWVLVRDYNNGEWNLTMFSYLNRDSSFLFICINGVSFKQCIPFEGNEKLLGTTEPCGEEYINW